jgi:hypothetical protein
MPCHARLIRKIRLSLIRMVRHTRQPSRKFARLSSTDNPANFVKPRHILCSFAIYLKVSTKTPNKAFVLFLVFLFCVVRFRNITCRATVSEAVTRSSSCLLRRALTESVRYYRKLFFETIYTTQLTSNNNLQQHY